MAVAVVVVAVAIAVVVVVGANGLNLLTWSVCALMTMTTTMKTILSMESESVAALTAVGACTFETLRGCSWAVGCGDYREEISFRPFPTSTGLSLLAL